MLKHAKYSIQRHVHVLQIKHGFYAQVDHMKREYERLHKRYNQRKNAKPSTASTSSSNSQTSSNDIKRLTAKIDVSILVEKAVDFNMYLNDISIRKMLVHTSPLSHARITFWPYYHK